MLDLKSFVVNGELIIDKPHWYQLNNSHDRQELKDAISNVIDELDLPLVEITEEEAKQDFYELAKFDARTLLNKDSLYSKADYSYELSHWYIKNSVIGRKASNYFHQFARWKVQHARHTSPYRSWTIKKFHQTFLNPLWTLNIPEVNNKTLRMCIQMRMYMAAQYPPAVAKALYNLFEAKDVLDFSMGWGDRLAGFYASEYGKHYVGIDPRKENHPIYKEQAKFYDTHLGFFEHDRKSEFYCSPAEDFDFSQYNEYFDLVFTSPPYFSVERYSYDDTQSWVRYKDIEDWNKDFLQTTLGNLWGSIKSGGYLLVNISDVYTNSKWSTDRGWLEICNPMNDYLSKLGEYQGCIGMEMAKRPNSGGAGTAKTYEGSVWTEKSLENKADKKFGEPIWIWKKT